MDVVTSKQETRVVTICGYLALLVLGAVEGLIGSFQYSHTAGSFPLASILFCLAILATCLLGGWGMGGVTGALMPAFGWIIASFVLSMGAASGSVVITATAPGEWYLYGGTVSVVLGVGASFGTWIRGQAR
jgi:hypothetical protein